MEDPTIEDPTIARQWVRRMKAGERLFQEGDVDHRVFLLLDGRVEILKGGDKVAEIGVADSFIGEISGLTGKPRWASARTVIESTMLVVDNVEELFKAGESSWGLKLARVLAKRLDLTNERLVALQALLDESRSDDADITLVGKLKNVVGEAAKAQY